MELGIEYAVEIFCPVLTRYDATAQENGQEIFTISYRGLIADCERVISRDPMIGQPKFRQRIVPMNYYGKGLSFRYCDA